MKKIILVLISIFYILPTNNIFALAPRHWTWHLAAISIAHIDDLLSRGERYYARGNLFLAWNAYEKAYGLFKEIIKREILSGDIRSKRKCNRVLLERFVALRKAGLLREDKIYVFSVAEIKQHLELTEGQLADEKDLDAVFRSACWLYQYGDLEMAQILLEYILEKDPDNIAALNQLAFIYSTKKEEFWLTDSYEYCYPYAAQLLKRALVLDPENSQAAALSNKIKTWHTDISLLRKMGRKRVHLLRVESAETEKGYRIRYYGFRGSWCIQNETATNYLSHQIYQLAEAIEPCLPADIDTIKLSITDEMPDPAVTACVLGRSVCQVNVASRFIQDILQINNVKERTSLVRDQLTTFPDTKAQSEPRLPLKGAKNKPKLLFLTDYNTITTTVEYVYSYFAKEKGYSIDKKSVEDLERENFNCSVYDFILISNTIQINPKMKQIIQRIKELYPEVNVVVGGVNTVDIEKTIESLPEVNCVVKYEGVETLDRILNIIGRVSAHGVLDDRQISDLLELQDDCFYLRIGQATIMKNFDRLNIDDAIYLDPEYSSLFFDLGCPHNCRFCNLFKLHFPQRATIDHLMDFLRKRRAISLDSDKEAINLSCDNLLQHKKFCRKLFSQIIAEGLQESFSFNISDASLYSVLDKNRELDIAYLDLLDRANVTVQIWGIDGRSPAITKQNGKPIVNFTRFLELAGRYPMSRYSTIMSTPDSSVCDVLEQVVLNELLPVLKGNACPFILRSEGSMFTIEDMIFFPEKEKAKKNIFPRNKGALLGYNPHNEGPSNDARYNVHWEGYEIEDLQLNDYSLYWKKIVQAWMRSEDPELFALGSLVDLKSQERRFNRLGKVDYIAIFLDIKCAMKQNKKTGIISFIALLKKEYPEYSSDPIEMSA